MGAGAEQVFRGDGTASPAPRIITSKIISKPKLKLMPKRVIRAPRVLGAKTALDLEEIIYITHPVLFMIDFAGGCGTSLLRRGPRSRRSQIIN